MKDHKYLSDNKKMLPSMLVAKASKELEEEIKKELEKCESQKDTPKKKS